MSIVKNRNAIEATRHNKQHAIFIARYCSSINGGLRYRRYAVIELSPYIYKEYREENGKWIEIEGVTSFLIWNGEFQGYDDISTLIEE